MRIFLSGAFLVMIVVLVGWALGVRYSLTPSLPRGLYLQAENEIVRGTLILFCVPQEAVVLARRRGYLSGGNCPGSTKPLGKYVLAVPGDTVAVTASRLVVNNRPVANSSIQERDRSGRLVPHMPYGTHVVGHDSLWVFSPHHQYSYDSRYFGPIAAGDVLSTMRPLVTY